MGVRKLIVELFGATGLKNSEFFGLSDPYVIFSIGTTVFRSKVAVDQATAPVWNEKFVIPTLDSDTELLIRILNENNMATDDELGRVVIPLASYRHGESASSFALQCNGKPQGELKMNLSFESDGDHESKGLVEKTQDLFVGEKEEHDSESEKEEEVEKMIEKLEEEAEEKKEEREEEAAEIKEEAEETKEESEEKAEEKIEDAEDKAEETEEKVEEAKGKAERKKKKKHKHHHHLLRHLSGHKKSDDDGSSSSSDSDHEHSGREILHRIKTFL